MSINIKGFLAGLLSGVFCLGLSAFGSELVQPTVSSFTEKYYSYYFSLYEKAKAAHLNNTNDVETALKFAKSCFELGEFATNSAQRASLANEGIEVCKEIIKTNSLNAEAHYWLAMNYAQLSRTKGWGALKIVNEMEKEYLKAIEINPRIDYAGPHRLLGLLYRDAPGWPISIGSKTKARHHLEQAVKLAPEFPDNQIFLIESYLKWSEKKLAEEQYKKALPLIESARAVFHGKEWEASWDDWNNRLKKIESKLNIKN